MEAGLSAQDGDAVLEVEFCEQVGRASSLGLDEDSVGAKGRDGSRLNGVGKRNREIREKEGTEKEGTETGLKIEN